VAVPVAAAVPVALGEPTTDACAAATVVAVPVPPGVAVAN
jgi:hypothetical protein